MSSDISQEFDMMSDRITSEVEEGFATLDDYFGNIAQECMALESFIQTLPAFPNTLSPLQIRLAQFLGCKQLSLEGFEHSHTGSVLTVEALESLNREKAKEIIKGADSVMDWLFHILDHLHETVDQFLAQAGGYQHRLEALKDLPAAKGQFVYKSIVRNLSWDGQVKPNEIPVHLDKFLTKAHAVRTSIKDPSFDKLMSEIKSFKSSVDASTNDAAMDVVFKQLKSYLKTILPSVTTEPLAHLEVIQGRELLYDPNNYISDHKFYAYAPVHPEGAVNTVTSGIVRTNQETDLKQEIQYLSPAQALKILDVVKSHLHDFSDAEKFKVASSHLRQLQTELFQKYSKAKRMRKDPVDATPYVMLMNIVAGLLYGMHVKALNKSVSVITAVMRYVSKSLDALEREHSQTPPAKEQ